MPAADLLGPCGRPGARGYYVVNLAVNVEVS